MSTKKPTRFCKDCHWSRHDSCTRPGIHIDYTPVDGRMTRSSEYRRLLWAQRLPRWGLDVLLRRCGKRGRFFLPVNADPTLPPKQ